MSSSPPDVLQGVLPPHLPLLGSGCLPLSPPSCPASSYIKRKSTSPSSGPTASRKIHVSEDVVSRTMADLYISHPKAKVARRNVDCDVSQSMNVEGLKDLETKFSSQANIANEDFPLPPQRMRKLPVRSKVPPGNNQKSPQLRLSIHQELRNLRSCSAILPESLVSRYRPSPKSTAVVLWKPPSGVLASAGQHNTSQGGRQRNRCFSEVTSTPYSSAENLCVDSEMPEPGSLRLSGSAVSHCVSPCNGLPLPGLSTHPAEAPDLSNYSQEVSQRP